MEANPGWLSKSSPFDIGFVLPKIIDGTGSYDRFREQLQTDNPVNEKGTINMKKYWEITIDGKEYLELYDRVAATGGLDLVRPKSFFPAPGVLMEPYVKPS